MSQTKKPLPVCDTESGSGEQCVLADIRISETEYTIPRLKTQCIADLLLCGEKNAIPLQHLEKITGLDQREIRRMIHAERLRGAPILANNRSGYYLPGNDGEKCERIPVTEHLLDANHHVNNGKYVEVAASLVPETSAAKRIRVEYRKQAFLGESFVPRIFRANDRITVTLSDEQNNPYTVVEFSL